MAANPDLETETSWTYEAGFMKELPFKTKMRAAAYYMDISDYQQHNYVPGEPSAQVYNIDVELYGIELDFTKSFSSGFSGYLNYTWKNWSHDDHPFDTEKTHYFMNNQPQNSVKLGFSYRLWPGGLVTLNAKYMDERQSKNDETLGDFVLVNIGARHTFTYRDIKFILKGYVNNVTDQDYELRAGYPMPGVTSGIRGELKF